MASTDAAAPPPSGVAEGSEGGATQTAYACRLCRTLLFLPHHLAPPHDPHAHAFTYRRRVKERDAVGLRVPTEGGGEGEDAPPPPDECTAYFLKDALPWMAGAEEVESKLNCPKCRARLGSLNWAGSQCSCGSWITPSIKIAKKAVDVRTVRAPPAAGAP